jgi:hypothetical protein
MIKIFIFYNFFIFQVFFSLQKEIKDVPVSIHIGHVLNTEKNGTSCANLVQKNNFLENFSKINLFDFLDKYKYFFVSCPIFIYLFNYFKSFIKKVDSIYENEVFTVLAESNFVYEYDSKIKILESGKVFGKYDKYEFLVMIVNLKKEIKSIFNFKFASIFKLFLIQFWNIRYLYLNKEKVFQRLDILLNKLNLLLFAC